VTPRPFPEDWSVALLMGGREAAARFERDPADDLWLLVAGERLGPDDWETILEEDARIEGGTLAREAAFRRVDGSMPRARLEVYFRRAPSHPRAFEYHAVLALGEARFESKRDRHLDAAVLHAAELARGDGDLVCCLTCKWSSYEPSAGWGHLYCHARSGDAYLRAAGSPDPMVRKWGFRDLPAVVEPDAPSMPPRHPAGASEALIAARWRGVVATEELHACEIFERGPPGFGYK
jgi:hypothetical protein